MSWKVLALRFVHGLASLYFFLCLLELYRATFTAQFNYVLAIAVISLGLEGVAVFLLNNGNCPLIHIQRRIGDDKPFFELFFPPRIAKQTLPIFARITWAGLGLLVVRFAFSHLK
jgi:hypothetical protein